MRAVTVLPFASFLLFLTVACSPSSGDADGNDSGDGDGDGDGDLPGTGGNGPGSGGLAGDGDGDFPGTGGNLGDGDGDVPGTGGSGNTGNLFTCPPGSESLVLMDLMTSPPTPTPITPVPKPPADNWFLEGPVWIGGALYMSQIREYGAPAPAHMLKYTPGGSVEMVVPDSGTNGLAVNAAGLIVATSHATKGLVTFDPANLAAAPVPTVTEYNSLAFNSPNDLTIRSDGTIYFTDPSWQCSGCSTQPVLGTYRVTPAGVVSLLSVSQTNPNGISLSPDEGTLYVGGNSLSAYPVNSDGSIGGGASFGSGTTDGMAVDCAGNVYATTGDSSVKVFSPAGVDLGSISAAGARNVAFGGPENKTLYIVGIGGGGGVLYSVELNVPGFPY